MSKANIITYLLVACVAVSGVNFLANRVSFLSYSNSLSNIIPEIKNNFKASSAGHLQEFSVTCAASATQVAPPQGHAQSIACKCDAAVAWGSDSVAVDDYQSDNWGANVDKAYCFGADDDCKCIAIVSNL